MNFSLTLRCGYKPIKILIAGVLQREIVKIVKRQLVEWMRILIR